MSETEGPALRRALEAAHLELKKHDADYHYRTDIGVSAQIVSALSAPQKTGEIDDLLRRLWEGPDSSRDVEAWHSLVAEAVSEIVSLRDQLAELQSAYNGQMTVLNSMSVKLEEAREALRPFTKHYEAWMERLSDDDRMSVYPVHTMGDLRRALAALRE